jgi:two-component system, OmpR family, KDP operon response regulator KdpE
MSKLRILIVEDEADIRRFIRLSLEREGMTVFEAGTAAQARIESASRQPPAASGDRRSRSSR